MARWAILALVTLASAATALAALAVAPLAPFLVASLGLSRGQVGWLLPAGWLTDRHGVRVTLAVGQALTGGMVALAGLASDRLSALLACLVIGGFGFSVGNPATGKAVMEWFPSHERGLAMGIKQTGLTLGGIGGALLLPPLALEFGWRHALMIAGGLSAVAAVAVALGYARPPLARTVPPLPRPHVRDLSEFIRRPGVQALFACGFLLSLAQSSLLAYFALYATESFALSAVAAGWLLALAQAGGTASRLVWGVLSDRFLRGRRRPGVVITALIGAGAFAIFGLGVTLPMPIVAVLALIAGAGAFGWVGLYFALVAEIGGTRAAGLLTGVAVAAAWSGVLVGPLLFGLVLEITGSYGPAWLLMAAVAIAVAVVLARLQPLVQRGPA
jgi:ACS family hexuronate transporter-like MFS transporter